MSSRRQRPLDLTEQDLFPEVGTGLNPAAANNKDRDVWLGALRGALAARSSRSIEIAKQALQAWPADPDLLLLAALTATATGKPERSLALLKRYGKRYVSSKPASLLTALALGAQEQHAQALAMLRAEKLDSDQAALNQFVGEEGMTDWLLAHLREIRMLGSLSLWKARAKVPAKPRERL